jgi:hypothetical protein
MKSAASLLISGPALLLALLVTFASSRSDLAASETRIFTQKPSVAESRVRDAAGAAAPSSEQPPAVAEAPDAPQAEWIWGAANAGENDRYVFRKEFEVEGRLTSAVLVATGDNQITVFLNGRKVLEDEDWESPGRANVRRHINSGTNTLIVEGANAGGPAGVALKLVLTTRDGQTSAIVTDNSWTAARSRDAAEWAAVHTLGKMGAQPWGDIFGQGGRALLPDAPREVFLVQPGFRSSCSTRFPKRRRAPGSVSRWTTRGASWPATRRSRVSTASRPRRPARMH